MLECLSQVCFERQGPKMSCKSRSCRLFHFLSEPTRKKKRDTLLFLLHFHSQEICGSKMCLAPWQLQPGTLLLTFEALEGEDHMCHPALCHPSLVALGKSL